MEYNTSCSAISVLLINKENEPDIPKIVSHHLQMYWRHKVARQCLRHTAIFQARKRAMNTNQHEWYRWSSRKRTAELLLDESYTATFSNTWCIYYTYLYSWRNFSRNVEAYNIIPMSFSKHDNILKI